MKTIQKKGLIFDIQRFSVHDGPGIRTLVFLKGCPLRCKWCSNPESQLKQQQIMFLKQNCIHCSQCLKVCPHDAIMFTPSFKIDENQCDMCGECVEVCYSEALHLTGVPYDVNEVINELQKDHSHYRRSGGGITLSGGEPLSQPEFSKELLMACKAKGWHTAIETTGYTTEAVIQNISPWLDLVLFDMKHTDDHKHQQFIGKSNQTILHNAQFFSQQGVQMIVRVPVIPTFNDQSHEIKAIAQFASNLNGVKELHLLPYHRLGEIKYDYLNYPFSLQGVQPPTAEKMKELQKIVEKTGLICKIGG